MRLADDFYFLELLEYERGVFSAEVSINPNHRIYEGHFPAGAVVPGVCTLTVIRECLSKAMGREIAFAAIKECKFVSALIPEKDLRIRMDFTITDSGQLKGLVTTPGPEGEQIGIKLKASLS